MSPLRETSEQDPPARLCALGAGALNDAELLTVIVGRPGGALLERFGGLDALSRVPVAQLATVRGIGQVQAARLHAAVHLGVRLQRRRTVAAKLDDASRIAELLGPEMRLLQQESARVVLLNAKLHLIAVEEVSRGLLDQALVHAREVFGPAVARRAYAAVLVHNL